MPEGPEVFVLAKVLSSLGFEASSIGKHLIVRDVHTGKLFDISFGLFGRIKLGERLTLHKVEKEGVPCGYKHEIKCKKEVEENLGVDWMSASKEQFESLVRSWKNRKKQIKDLLTNQKEICGIGKVWCEQILRVAKIQGIIKANLLDFLNLERSLVNALLSVREKAKRSYLNQIGTKELDFINKWPENLFFFNLTFK